VSADVFLQPTKIPSHQQQQKNKHCTSRKILKNTRFENENIVGDVWYKQYAETDNIRTDIKEQISQSTFTTPVQT